MVSPSVVKQPVALLRAAVNSLIANPLILFPFVVVAFIQILVLEILFFAPRFPLNLFFGPIILKTQGQLFLHYPFNYVLLNKWFQAVQVPLYILVNSFYMGVAVHLIDAVNSGRPVNMKAAFRKTVPAYIHLIVAALIAVLVLMVFSKVYGLVINRALAIRSTQGIYFIMKQIVLVGAPYFNLIFAIFVTTLFAFVIPIIVLEQKKIFAAIALNFKHLMKSFWFILLVMALAGLLYLPVFLLKSSGKFFQQVAVPEIWGVVLIGSIFVGLLIDAIQITAVTTYYLLKKDA